MLGCTRSTSKPKRKDDEANSFDTFTTPGTVVSPAESKRCRLTSPPAPTKRKRQQEPEQEQKMRDDVTHYVGMVAISDAVLDPPVAKRRRLTSLPAPTRRKRPPNVEHDSRDATKIARVGAAGSAGGHKRLRANVDVIEQFAGSPEPSEIVPPGSSSIKQHQQRTDGALQTKYGFWIGHNYFPHFRHLYEFYRKHVDIFAVCSAGSSDVQRVASGPKDFYTTFELVDLAVSDGVRVPVTVFRPYRIALPVIHQGSVVLLRNFLVGSHKRKPCLTSTRSSAWAIWSATEQARQDYGPPQAVISGAPLELESTVIDHVTFLSQLSAKWTFDISTKVSL